MQDVCDFDRQAWVVIVAVGAGNILLVLAGLAGYPLYSLIMLAVISFAWVLLLQFTRVIMHSSLALAQKSTQEWQAESDFARELLDEHLRTIQDLEQYDMQSCGVHLERLRETLVARHPELENVIAEVDHPVNVAGIVI
jgi:type III secretory pathway component EscV